MTYCVIILFFIWGQLEGTTVCPKECSCSLDEKGHWQVLCLSGGLVDPLPVLVMPSHTEILIVTAPEGKSNSLTLGPIFRGLPNLEEIHVTYSNVPALGEHSFWGLRKLSVLNISYNSITALRPANFRGPEALNVLDLSHNNIESTPSAVFRHTKYLKVLNLSNNRMPELVPKMFFGLSQLETLDLSCNPLGDLPYDRFTDIQNLKEFKCGNCGLLDINQKLFKELQHLKFLDLCNNRLTVVPPINFIYSLSTLKLNGNHISLIKREEFKSPSLHELHISHNRISSIEENAFENSSLKYLDLSYNRLNVLESQIIDPILLVLKYLSLSGNSLHMDQLKEILPKARQLRHLNIGDLGLTRLPPDILRRSRNLRILNISSNYLSKFPHELLYSTPNLQMLDLSANSFRGLSQHVVTAFSSMSSLTEIHLERNPWICQECYVSYLISWLKSTSKQIHSVSSCKEDLSSLMCLKCVGPEKYANEPMILLAEETLDECTTSGNSFWPLWEGGNDITQADEPLSSINKRGSLEKNEKPHLKKVASFFKDHLALLIGIVCGLILAIMLVVITALACSRRQSAFYYTTEGDKEKNEKLVGRNNNDSPTPNQSTNITKTSPSDDVSSVPQYEQMAISKVHSRTPICNTSKTSITSTLSSKRRPKIATIEEITALDV
ncbi:UNVERIFIED_CONTAM: hypothetical protein RMT77_012892 [Armadillidium vulgare]